MTYLQGSLCLDLLHHDVCKRLVKLETTVTFLTTQNAAVSSTCCKTFIASWGVIAPLVMSSSRESVRAIPMLNSQVVFCNDMGIDEEEDAR